MTELSEIDDMIRENVRAQLDEKAARRQRMKRRRAEFEAARAAGLVSRRRQRLANIEGGKQP